MKWNLEEVVAIEEHIKTATSCQHPPLEDLVVTGISESQISTPLLMACQHGDLEAVKRIIEIWGVNVSTAAVTNTIWPYTRVEGVTPLFVAAFYHHSKIVKYLIDKGADINSRTHSTDQEYSGMTPLYAAAVFSDESDQESQKIERISTVRLLLQSGADPSPLTDDGEPIWFRQELPVSLRSQIITLLVEWGMDLNQRGPDAGNTVLHSWAEVVLDNQENESLGIVQMLLEKGADLQARDSSGVSIILTAAIGDGDLPNLTVLDYLLEKNDIPRQDKIDALETAGAIILGHDENHEKFPLAFQLWRRALTLRLMDNQDPLHKMPLTSKSGQLSEWTTLDDIQQIEQDPHPAQREIQSLLVKLRIFAHLSPRNMDYYMENDLLVFLEKGEDDGRSFNQMMDISLMAMDIIFRYDPIESKLLSSTIDVIGELLSVFHDLPNEDPNVNSATLKTLVELVAKMDQLHLPDANQKIVADIGYIVSLKILVEILSSRPELFNEEMKESLVRMVRRDVRDSDGLNVLLIACCYSDAETLSTIRLLLLELDVDTNAVINVGDGPLHLLARWSEDTETRDAIARVLLESGAHLDMVNKEGMTAADLWLKINKEVGEDVDVLDLPKWLQEDVSNLKCLCSRVIHHHRLSYNDEAILPAVLIPFVALHCIDSHAVEDLKEVEDSQEVEDVELDEPNSKKDELKLSPEMEHDSFDEIEDSNKSLSDKLGLSPASEKLAAKVEKAGGGKKEGPQFESAAPVR